MLLVSVAELTQASEVEPVALTSVPGAPLLGEKLKVFELAEAAPADANSARVREIAAEMTEAGRRTRRFSSVRDIGDSDERTGAESTDRARTK